MIGEDYVLVIARAVWTGILDSNISSVSYQYSDLGVELGNLTMLLVGEVGGCSWYEDMRW
jgi:hypothetical protein